MTKLKNALGCLAALGVTLMACKESAPASSTPAASATPSAVIAPSASAVAASSAAPSASVAPAGEPSPASVECKTSITAKDSIHAHFSMETMGGTVEIDGVNQDTRRFQIHATPYKATYSLMFDAYGEGDKKPAKEKLTTGKSVVARLVANGDKQELYFDSDVALSGADKKPVRTALVCEPKAK